MVSHSETYLLNTIVERKHSPQLRTAPLSAANIDVLLQGNPVAITLAPLGTSSGERLLDLFIVKSDLFRPLLRVPKTTKRWLLYVGGHRSFRFKDYVLNSDLFAKESSFRKVFISHSWGDAAMAALVPEMPWTLKQKDAIRTALTQVIVRRRLPNPRRARARTSAEGLSDRAELIRARKAMLDEVGTYTSEDLASAAVSTTTNPSQFASDQRDTGKVFGVRFGREWLYPKFQFDSKRQTVDEMKAVLAALSPDKQGWDRLQWFLEPHEELDGETPLEVWKSDRRRVIEAANAERWHGRD